MNTFKPPIMSASYSLQKLSSKVDFQWLNESSAMLVFDAKQSTLNLHDRNVLVQAWCRQIESMQAPWLIDCVASYQSILIEFDCQLIDHYALYAHLSELKIQAQSNGNGNGKDNNNSKVHTIPVCYTNIDEQYPNDLQVVASQKALSTQAIIDLHSQKSYRVYAVGFMPNFAYLGELDKQLHIPRLKHPRKTLPPGAVAIADEQTAVYPSASPGGWHIIGYTPVNLMHNTQYQFSVGDSVKFAAISLHEYKAVKAKASA